MRFPCWGAAEPLASTVHSVPVALITGAARPNGLAAAIAPRLASDGWEVVTSDRDLGVGYDTTRRGDFYLATSGDLDLATSGDSFMAADTRSCRSIWFR